MDMLFTEFTIAASRGQSGVKDIIARFALSPSGSLVEGVGQSACRLCSTARETKHFFERQRGTSLH